jgi:hypothetical protein
MIPWIPFFNRIRPVYTITQNRRLSGHKFRAIMGAQVQNALRAGSFQGTQQAGAIGLTQPSIALPSRSRTPVGARAALTFLAVATAWRGQRLEWQVPCWEKGDEQTGSEWSWLHSGGTCIGHLGGSGLVRGGLRRDR